MLLASASGLGWLVLMIVAVGLALALRNLRRDRSGLAAPAPWRPPQRIKPAAGGTPHTLDAPTELRRWQVELEELGRETSARLDNKLSMLQYLLAESTRVADRLEHLLAQSSARLEGEPVAPGADPAPQ